MRAGISKPSEIVLLADRNLCVVLAAVIFGPNRAGTGIAPVFLVDRPGPRQRVIDHGHFVVQDVRIGLVEMDSLLENRLIVEGERQAGRIIGTGSLERPAGLDFEHVVAAVAVLVDPFADRIARERRIEPRRPVAPVSEDSPTMVVIIDQEVGGFRGDDLFLRPERHHHVRHAGREAPRGRIIAQSAVGLIREARVEHRLILGRKRCLLSIAPGSGLVVRWLARQPRDNEPRPLTLPVGIS